MVRCERINNFSVTLLEVPSYVYEGTYRTATGSSPRMHGNIELGLKGQRDTAMQSEQNKTVPVVPLVAESVCHVCG